MVDGATATPTRKAATYFTATVHTTRPNSSDAFVYRNVGYTCMPADKKKKKNNNNNKNKQRSNRSAHGEWVGG